MKTQRAMMAFFFTLILIMPMNGIAATKANPVIDETTITLTTSMYATFNAETSYTCSKIWVSSCYLQRMSSTGTVLSSTLVPAPTKSSSNTSSFDAEKSYSSYVTSGQRYRIKATFKATYNSTTYSTTAYSAIKTAN